MRRRVGALGVVTLALGVTVSLVAAETSKDPRELAEQARKNAAVVTLPSKPTPYADVARIEALRNQAVQRAKQALAGMSGAPAEAGAAAESVLADERGSARTPVKPAPVLSGRLVIALSSSMPEATLREYMRQLDGVSEAIVVLRGFIGGARTVKPTGLWIEDMRRRDPTCHTCGHRRVEVVVDPLLYRSLAINKVPAVAYLPGVQDLKHCDAETLQAVPVAYGAVSVSAALKQLTKDGAAIPAELIERLARRT
jgi:type-F conjugative transfer system pilin assembly protein TrbC